LALIWLSCLEEPLQFGLIVLSATRTPTATATTPPAKRAARRHVPTVHPATIIVAGAGAGLVRETVRTGLSGDVFYELAAGRWMLAHHAILRHDVFTYTVAGRRWLDEEWGFQVLLAWLVAHVGPVSYWLVSGGASTAALLASLALWRRNGAGWLWAGALSVVAAAGLSVGLTPRPQDLSYLLFALLLLLLRLARQSPRWLAAVPVLMLAWANVHGSFLLGLVVVAVELGWSAVVSRSATQHVRQLGLCLFASTVATFANPAGPRLLAYAFHVSSSPALASIQEWQSPDFHVPLLLAITAGPLLFLTAAIAFAKTSLGPQQVLLALALFVATLHAVRFAPYFDLAACAALAPWHPFGLETLRPSPLAMPAAIALAAALLAGPHVPPGATQVRGPLGSPVAATNFLARQRGRSFTTYWWGDYLDYRGIRVFVDGRTDLYFGTEVLASYIRVSELQMSPDKFLSRWRVKWVMWPKGAALATYLAHDPLWATVFQAQGAVVFERRDQTARQDGSS
jgi:hypothetical protein